MADEVDGFYAAYFSGAVGNSMALFAFRDGSITGVDVGGVHYDGTFAVDALRTRLVGSINYTVAPGQQIITGATAGSEPLRFNFPLELPIGFADGRVPGLPTPSGPINARFEKVRGW